MLSALEEIAGQLTRLIEEDPFPRQIQPDYLREAVLAYPLLGGKRLRPALTLWSCGLVGGNPDRAWQAALAIELYHNWTLIHDDIIDNDSLRRSSPTCHVFISEEATKRFGNDRGESNARFGRNMAILAGDILHGWSMQALGQLHHRGGSHELASVLMQRMAGWVTPRLISGESLDIEFERRSDLSSEEVEHMLTLKTGILLQFAAEAGAMVGLNVANPTHPTVTRLGELARTAGLAFQLQDDILGVFGEDKTLGKPVGSDLREGKRTLLIVHALEKASDADKKWLTDILGTPDMSLEQVERARQIILDSGALGAVQCRAAELLSAVSRILSEFSPCHYRDLLEQWVDFLLERRY